MNAQLTALRSCLLVVSHPDDDALFAGELQSRLGDATWWVVCVTGHADDARSGELIHWQSSLGTEPARIHFLGQPDDPEDWRRRRCSIDPAAVEDGLSKLRLRPDLVVSHNQEGEYGHPHHALTHRCAASVYRATPLLVFGMGLDHVDYTLHCPNKPETLRRFFPSQRKAISRLARTKERFAWHHGGDAGVTIPSDE